MIGPRIHGAFGGFGFLGPRCFVSQDGRHACDTAACLRIVLQQQHVIVIPRLECEHQILAVCISIRGNLIAGLYRILAMELYCKRRSSGVKVVSCVFVSQYDAIVSQDCIVS